MTSIEVDFYLQFARSIYCSLAFVGGIEHGGIAWRHFPSVNVMWCKR